jgi:hypothetical protein
MTKRQEDIYIIPIDRQSKTETINLDTIKNCVVFSEEFWDYFTGTFPYATIGLFYNGRTESGFQLSDTSYDYSLISYHNRLSIINRLPKDLSEKESNSYFKGGGFFVVPNDSIHDNINQGQTEAEETTKWLKASEQVEKEYLQFYQLLKNMDNDYLIIAKTKLIDNLVPKRN